jgi:hypothetical protein
LKSVHDYYERAIIGKRTIDNAKAFQESLRAEFQSNPANAEQYVTVRKTLELAEQNFALQLRNIEKRISEAEEEATVNEQKLTSQITELSKIIEKTKSALAEVEERKKTLTDNLTLQRAESKKVSTSNDGNPEIKEVVGEIQTLKKDIDILQKSLDDENVPGLIKSLLSSIGHCDQRIQEFKEQLTKDVNTCISIQGGDSLDTVQTQELKTLREHQKVFEIQAQNTEEAISHMLEGYKAFLDKTLQPAPKPSQELQAAAQAFSLFHPETKQPATKPASSAAAQQHPQPEQQQQPAAAAAQQTAAAAAEQQQQQLAAAAAQQVRQRQQRKPKIYVYDGIVACDGKNKAGKYIFGGMTIQPKSSIVKINGEDYLKDSDVTYCLKDFEVIRCNSLEELKKSIELHNDLAGRTQMERIKEYEAKIKKAKKAPPPERPSGPTVLKLRKGDKNITTEYVVKKPDGKKIATTLIILQNREAQRKKRLTEQQPAEQQSASDNVSTARRQAEALARRKTAPERRRAKAAAAATEARQQQPAAAAAQQLAAAAAQQGHQLAAATAAQQPPAAQQEQQQQQQPPAAQPPPPPAQQQQQQPTATLQELLANIQKLQQQLAAVATPVPVQQVRQQQPATAVMAWKAQQDIISEWRALVQGSAPELKKIQKEGLNTPEFRCAQLSVLESLYQGDTDLDIYSIPYLTSECTELNVTTKADVT